MKATDRECVVCQKVGPRESLIQLLPETEPEVFVCSQACADAYLEAKEHQDDKS